VIKPSGVSRGGKASRHRAAGDSATSDASGVKRRRGWRVAFLTLAAAGIVGGAAWVLFGSPLLVVRSVTVSGTRLVPKSEVLAVAGIAPGTPLIRVNTARVEARVDTIKQVRSAKVTRAWPNRLVITVREWTPALALTAPGGGYDLAAADGAVVAWAARRPADLPLYRAASPGVSLRGDPDFAAAAAVLAELSPTLRHAVESVTAPSPDQVTLHLAGGTTVVWGGTDRASAKAAELGALMRTHLHYYDVSAPGSATAK
jgi:cell division protein FtsQ